MSSKRTYIATFWRSNPQLKNGGYFTTKEFQSVSLQGATKQAERYAASNMYGGMAVKSVELKQENAMENNKSQFKRTGVLHDGAECIEIQISHSGDAARYVSTIMFTVRDPEVTRGRWQEIRYSKRNGYAYIVKYGKRLYLHKFLRIY